MDEIFRIATIFHNYFLHFKQWALALHLDLIVSWTSLLTLIFILATLTPKLSLLYDGSYFSKLNTKFLCSGRGSSNQNVEAWVLP